MIVISIDTYIVEGVGISLSKFLHGTSELVISDHLIYSVYHNTLILRVHPPGILVSNGMNAHCKQRYVLTIYRPVTFICLLPLIFLIKQKKAKLGHRQTCIRPKVFVISYLLFWPALIWQIFWEEKFKALPPKNKVVDENLPLWTRFFSSATLFLEGSALNFSTPKKFVWFLVKITNMILQKLQVLCTFVSALYISFAPHFHAHLFVTGQNLVKTHLERQLDWDPQQKS